jgi:hypothetical protein
MKEKIKTDVRTGIYSKETHWKPIIVGLLS